MSSLELKSIRDQKSTYLEVASCVWGGFADCSVCEEVVGFLQPHQLGDKLLQLPTSVTQYTFQQLCIPYERLTAARREGDTGAVTSVHTHMCVHILTYRQYIYTYTISSTSDSVHIRTYICTYVHSHIGST